MTPRCPETTNHHPEGFPWSLTAHCVLKSGHESRVHRARVSGYLILWKTR